MAINSDDPIRREAYEKALKFLRSRPPSKIFLQKWPDDVPEILGSKDDIERKN